MYRIVTVHCVYVSSYFPTKLWHNIGQGCQIILLFFFLFLCEKKIYIWLKIQDDIMCAYPPPPTHTHTYLIGLRIVNMKLINPLLNGSSFPWWITTDTNLFSFVPMLDTLLIAFYFCNFYLLILVFLSFYSNWTLCLHSSSISIHFSLSNTIR